MAFQLPPTTQLPPNFQAGGGMPYTANPNAQPMPGQMPPANAPSPWSVTGMQTPQQLGNNTLQPISNAVQQAQGGLPSATTPPPQSWNTGGTPGAVQGYLNRGVGMGGPQTGPTVRGNGMPNPTGAPPLMGTNPQFNRIR